jgi:hypothetical protein
MHKNNPALAADFASAYMPQGLKAMSFVPIVGTVETVP